MEAQLHSLDNVHLCSLVQTWLDLSMNAPIAGSCSVGALTSNSEVPPPPCTSYADVHNYYAPYAYCSLDKGVACAQHIQLPTHVRA